jgi:hypothetical protein
MLRYKRFDPRAIAHQKHIPQALSLRAHAAGHDLFRGVISAHRIHRDAYRARFTAVHDVHQVASYAFYTATSCRSEHPRKALRVEGQHGMIAELSWGGKKWQSAATFAARARWPETM